MDNSSLNGLKELFYEECTNYVQIGEVTASEQALVLLMSEIAPVLLQIFSNGYVNISDDQNLHLKNMGKRSPAITLLLNVTFKDQLETFAKKHIGSKYDFKEFKDDYSIDTPKRKDNALSRIIKQKDYEKLVILKKKDGTLIVEAHGGMSSTLTEDDVKKLESEKEFGRIEKNYRKGKVVSAKTIDVYKL